LARRLESAKHYLWHGNSAMALTRLEDIEDDLESWGDDEGGQQARSDRGAAARMGKYVRELAVYIAHNAVRSSTTASDIGMANGSAPRSRSQRSTRW